MNSSIAYSTLPADVQAQADKYLNNGYFVTFAKPVLSDFVRFAIGTFAEMDTMLANGWLVIDRTR